MLFQFILQITYFIRDLNQTPTGSNMKRKSLLHFEYEFALPIIFVAGCIFFLSLFLILIPANTPDAQFNVNITDDQLPLILPFTDQPFSGDMNSYQGDMNDTFGAESNPIDNTTEVVRNSSMIFSVTDIYLPHIASPDDQLLNALKSAKSSDLVFEKEFSRMNSMSNPIGGGDGYTTIYTEGNASITVKVTTADEFIAALKNASEGNVIYIPENVNINMTGIYSTTIPGGVTLASNRGSNASKGGRIFQNRVSSDDRKAVNLNGDVSSMLITGGDNVRITGLRIEGPDKTTDNSMGDNATKTGIYVRNYQGFEVDNCEIWGWSGSGVSVNIWNTSLQTKGLLTSEIGSTIANIHHNYIHHCQTDGAGYGVVVSGGAALIKANIFDYTRHAVADTGAPTDGYEASYNIHLGHSNGHIFDVHGYSYLGNTIAGNLYKIHHNTIRAPVPSEIWWAVGIRGLPLNQVYINFNNFRCTTVASPLQHAPPVFQLTTGGVGNITMTKNIIDGEYSANGPIRLRANETTDWW
jgi:hypothetical protein